MGGMPSRGGPPDMTLEKSMPDFEKSVFQPSARQRSGSAAAPTAEAARNRPATSAMLMRPVSLACKARIDLGGTNLFMN
jgi:hypothetical protein